MAPTRAIKRQGGRVGAGAPAGNRNGQKRIQALPEWLNLDDSKSVLAFVRGVLIPAALSGRLGVRTITAINSSCKLLLDFDEDLIRLKELEERMIVMEQEGREVGDCGH